MFNTCCLCETEQQQAQFEVRRWDDALDTRLKYPRSPTLDRSLRFPPHTWIHVPVRASRKNVTFNGEGTSPITENSSDKAEHAIDSSDKVEEATDSSDKVEDATDSSDKVATDSSDKATRTNVSDSPPPPPPLAVVVSHYCPVFVSGCASLL
eukprot:GHVO01066197.1.p1 GENE.GHVO01066197.1~~GHVO01066197.1.p1  ORF type:complete len:152 (+),score=39.32 GHVO01066197.1:35-490(+)